MYLFELAFILSVRKIHISSGLNKSILTERVGTVSSEETELLEYWKTIANELSDYYPNFNSAELKSLLEIKTNFCFNIPLQYFTKKQKEYILAYYKIYNYPILFPDKEWTSEQLETINYNKDILVVNSSAGTGKTSCANEKAVRLKTEGVLLISYTNEAINENYKRIHEYPGLKGFLGKKDYDKYLNITTADSLASRIIGAVGSEGHDISIRTAIEYIQNNSDIYHKFTIPGRGLFYNHIIVDECQDIDDLRGELLITLFRMLKFKSLTLFGDPKQRVRENCGIWYSKLWDKSYEFSELPNKNIPNVHRIGFTYSYRFQNSYMVELANSLSERRINIHYPLQSHPSVPQLEPTIPIELIPCNDNNEDGVIELVATYIRDILKISYNKICVVGPSLSKENKTSFTAQKIFTIFKEYNISCYTKAEGSYIPNAVLFSTIHSIKGKEFDYIFVFGISNYPSSFHMIPYDEAESLMFVLHTRARKKIFYIGANNFEIPRGINKKYINNYTEPINSYKNRIHEPEPHPFKVSEISVDFNLIKFLRVNNFILEGTSLKSITSLSSPPEGINDKFWGILSSLGVQIAMTGKHLDIIERFSNGDCLAVSLKQYENMKRHNTIIKGKSILDNKIIICNESINVPREDEIINLREIIKKPITELKWEDYIHLTKICEYLYGENTKYDIKIEKSHDIGPLFFQIAKDIKETFSEECKSEIYVQNLNLIGCINVCTNTHVIDFNTLFKENNHSFYLQTWLNFLLNSDKLKIPIIINLQSGQITKISSNNSFERWQYILESYYQIRTHVELVNFRVTQAINNGLVPKNFPNNTYLVDTEFSPSFNNKYNNTNEIFDLACVNINDPYSSLVQTIRPKAENLAFAVEWLKKPMELFITSPSMKEIVDDIFYNIQRIHSTSDVDLQYYLSPVDVNWYPLANKTNLGSIARDIGIKNGIFLAGGQPPMLGNLYSQLCKPLEFQKHLHPHTALSDALMLYELKRLNIF